MNIVKKLIEKFFAQGAQPHVVLTCNTIDNYYADLVCVETDMPSGKSRLD